jgi:hypothetical protein
MTRSRSLSVLVAVAAAIAVLEAPVPATAANGDCSQPISDGSGPVASDCLFVLRSAVGSAECAPCVCDTNASGSTTASDALLCLRAAVGQSVTLECAPCCPGPANVSPEDFEARLLATLDENQDFNVPASCGAQVALCCPGGVPQDPCGPVHVDQLETTTFQPQGQNHIDLTFRMRLDTMTAIPVQVPQVGNCSLEIDTSAGAQSTIRIDARLVLDEDGLVIADVTNVSITDLESSDYALTGGTACQLANVPASTAADVLEDPLSELLLLYVGMCLGTDVSVP